MSKTSKNLIVIMLVAALTMGAVANAIAGVKLCMPKTCCCAMTETPQMGHQEPQMTAGRCRPEKPAPCCQMEQEPQPTHMAISSVAEPVVYRYAVAPVSADAWVANDPHTPSIHRLLDEGRPKAPLVPIYLQTLSMLC